MLGLATKALVTLKWLICLRCTSLNGALVCLCLTCISLSVCLVVPGHTGSTAVWQSGRGVHGSKWRYAAAQRLIIDPFFFSDMLAAEGRGEHTLPASLQNSLRVHAVSFTGSTQDVYSMMGLLSTEGE